MDGLVKGLIRDPGGWPEVDIDRSIADQYVDPAVAVERLAHQVFQLILV